MLLNIINLNCMYTSNILRSASVAESIFEGRVPAVVLDLSKDMRRSIRNHSTPQAKQLIRESVQRYFDSLLWSVEKEEWNGRMTESDKLLFVDKFYQELSESREHQQAPETREYKVKNTIDYMLCNEQVYVSYSASKRNKYNIDVFHTVNEEHWLDLTEVIDVTGINIIDDLTEQEKREIIDQCWDDADELIDVAKRRG